MKTLQYLQQLTHAWQDIKFKLQEKKNYTHALIAMVRNFARGPRIPPLGESPNFLMQHGAFAQNVEALVIYFR